MTAAEAAGLHGQTLISSNLGRSSQFLEAALGLELRKRTVHPGDERVAVSHFGFPGAVGTGPTLTYIEWHPIFYALPPEGLVEPEVVRAALESPQVGDSRGRWGAGTIHHVAMHTPDRASLLRWKRRLVDLGVHVTGPYFRNYFHAIYFRDPDGAIMEIATTEPGFAYDEESLGSSHREAPDEAMAGARSEDQIAAEIHPEPVPEVDAQMALRGLHHITSVATDIDATTNFYVGQLGLDLIKRTDYLDAVDATHYYYSAAPNPEPGAVLTFFGFPGFAAGRLGVGVGHHFTLRCANAEALADWRERIQSSGVPVGPIQDHRYYQVAYLKDPDGHLLALATQPDFTIDEPADALGKRLCLPPDASRDAEARLAHRAAPTGRAPAPALGL